jgi:hypothetical protein
MLTGISGAQPASRPVVIRAKVMGADGRYGGLRGLRDLCGQNGVRVFVDIL